MAASVYRTRERNQRKIWIFDATTFVGARKGRNHASKVGRQWTHDNSQFTHNHHLHLWHCYLQFSILSTWYHHNFFIFFKNILLLQLVVVNCLLLLLLLLLILLRSVLHILCTLYEVLFYSLFITWSCFMRGRGGALLLYSVRDLTVTIAKYNVLLLLLVLRTVVTVYVNK
jgi:hypothetical protein